MAPDSLSKSNENDIVYFKRNYLQVIWPFYIELFWNGPNAAIMLMTSSGHQFVAPLIRSHLARSDV